MTKEKLLSTLVGSYHDGALLNALYKNGNLLMYCHRNPPDPDGVEDSNTRYIIMCFYNVIDLEVYDWRNSEEFVPYSNGAFRKDEASWAISGIDHLDYKNGFVVFDECVRFRCSDVELLESSNKELDFSKYCKINYAVSNKDGIIYFAKQYSLFGSLSSN